MLETVETFEDGHEVVSHVRIRHENGGVSIIELIEVPFDARSRGIGSEALVGLCGLADRDRRTLAVSPRADPPAWQGRIESWFMAFGFVPNRGAFIDRTISQAMYRRPVEDG